MTLEDLILEVSNILNALRVQFKINDLVKGVSKQLVISEYGTIVRCISRLAYKLTDDNIDDPYKDYRIVYITTEDPRYEFRTTILWALMRGGYIRQLRTQFKRSFTSLIIDQDFGRQIVTERLRIWNKRPKYSWWIAENEAALRQSASYILSVDPAFYDMMPEEE